MDIRVETRGQQRTRNGSLGSVGGSDSVRVNVSDEESDIFDPDWPVAGHAKKTERSIGASLKKNK